MTLIDLIKHLPSKHLDTSETVEVVLTLILMAPDTSLESSQTARMLSTGQCTSIPELATSTFLGLETISPHQMQEFQSRIAKLSLATAVVVTVVKVAKVAITVIMVTMGTMTGNVRLNATVLLTTSTAGTPVVSAWTEKRAETRDKIPAKKKATATTMALIASVNALTTMTNAGTNAFNAGKTTIKREKTVLMKEETALTMERKVTVN